MGCAVQFNNYTQVVQLCTYSYDGPVKHLMTLMTEEDVKNIVMGQLESVMADLVKSMTNNDVVRGGPSKSRFVALTSAIVAEPNIYATADIA